MPAPSRQGVVWGASAYGLAAIPQIRIGELHRAPTYAALGTVLSSGVGLGGSGRGLRDPDGYAITIQDAG
jgi:hypothetical protein